MKTRILNQEEITRLLTMSECIEVMERALVALAEGQGMQPLRSILWLPHQVGALGTMPGFLGQPPVLGIKVISVFPGNHGTSLDSHQGVVLLFEPDQGRLIAILDASSITGIRTAAVSGVATAVLAGKDASELAILGSGVQAATHLQAMAQVRQLRQVRIFSPNRDRCRQFVRREQARYKFPIQAVPSAEQAVRHADLICTVTAAKKPIVEAEWVQPGAHINAVGACTPGARELSGALVARGSLFTDRTESLFREAGDFLLARDEGLVEEASLCGELGQVLSGQVGGRRDQAEVTIFKSLGIAIEDLAAAHFLYRKAQSENAGVERMLGGLRHVTD